MNALGWLSQPGRGCLTSRRRGSRSHRQNAGFEPRPPARIDGAIWQAGITADSERFKVLFNGEPRADIVAAGDGWVLLLQGLTETKVRIGPHAPLGRQLLTDPLQSQRRISGTVRIVHLDGSPLTRLERHVMGIRD